MNYTELHLHTYYSLLDGLNSPAEYMERAKEIGMTHLAQTDHGTNSGHRDFQRAASAAGIVPILGQEMYISATDRFDRRTKAKRTDGTQTYNHIIVLAQDQKGLHNLNRLSEIAWTEGFYSKPRIDLDVLGEYNEGLIVLSGCLNGLISKAIANEQDALADSYTRELKGIFDERFFMEIQGHNPDEINDGLLALADKHHVLPVMTSDCHHARKEDMWMEEAMLIMSTKPTPGTDFDFSKSEKMDMLERFNYMYPDRKMTFEKFGLWLHTAEEHMANKWNPEVVKRAVANTMVVADMIGTYEYPEGLDLLPQPVEGDADTILEDLAWKGLAERGLENSQPHIERLTEELELVKSKKFSSYFIIERNAMERGRQKGIMFGPGRGSGAGSLLNYVLKNTGVDPLEYNLLVFRFIDPERSDYPDIDTDVEDRRRSEVKDDLLQEYKHVASIATFGAFQGKKAVRDASRVFRIPLAEVNKALKGADWPTNMDFFEKWGETDNGRAFMKKHPDVTSFAKWLVGRLATQGMHAGGIVVSKEPIINYAPIQSAEDKSDEAKNRIPLVALDMEQAAEIGFVKYDFLGLKALSIISDTLSKIEQRHGTVIDPYTIPLDDSRIYKSLSQGWTKGVFQAEALPYTNLLIKMGGVKNFDELVASNALVRPGAMKSSAGAKFIERKEGRQMVEYVHPDTKWFTDDTYGVVIYQEQVMLMMTELAGMTMGEANKVRKIIGKKRDVKEFDEYKDKFIDGASQKVPKKIAENLWHDFEAHAGYSFNKSHAVAYSMLSVWTAWLKENYPLEFMWAVLRNEGDKDAILDYLIEAKRLGIRILLPHINTSEAEFAIQRDERGDFIRFGLSNIKYLSGKASEKIISYRPFESYAQLSDIVDTKYSGLNTRMLGALNAVGAASFPDHPKTGNERENFFEYLNIPAFEVKALDPDMKAQMRTLSDYAEDECFVCMGMVRNIKTGPGWAKVDFVDETGAASAFTSEHTPIETGRMYVFLVADNRIARYATAEDVATGKAEKFCAFLNTTSFPDVPEGMHKVIAFTGRTTKAGKKMADVVITDEHKNLVSVKVWPSMFMKAFTRCREGAVVDLQIEETDDGTKFIKNIL